MKPIKHTYKPNKKEDREMFGYPFLLLIISWTLFALTYSAVNAGEKNQGIQLVFEMSKDQIINSTTELIAKHEKFKPHCYDDAGGLSQGYGHKCLGGSISRKRSKQILKNEVVRLYDKLPSTLDDHDYIGTISFLYNHPVGQTRYIDMIRDDFAEFQNVVKYKSENHIYIGGVRQGGLIIRRKEEYKYLSFDQ